MVTVEIAFGLTIVVFLMAAFAWIILLVGAQVQCIDAATEIARQVARGNRAAVEQATADAPDRAEIAVSSEGEDVVVTVSLESAPADWLPAVTLSADATAIKEPGEQ
jgi:hypothetical protein